MMRLFEKARRFFADGSAQYGHILVLQVSLQFGGVLFIVLIVSGLFIIKRDIIKLLHPSILT